MANIGTLVLFRLGAEDAEIFGKEFSSEWPVSNLVNLNPYEIYYKLMKQGTIEGPFQATTLPPPEIQKRRGLFIEASLGGTKGLAIPGFIPPPRLDGNPRSSCRLLAY